MLDLADGRLDVAVDERPHRGDQHLFFVIHLRTPSSVDPRFHSLPACGVVTSDGYAGIRAGGPYFDDLSVGQVFDWAPATTLSSGLAAAHQAIVGDRLRLALDAVLCTAVTGVPGPLAHPALVCDVAIGQSTLATQRVKANLFYRGLMFHRFPVIGDTIYTRTEVVGLRANSLKPGRAPTGLAALRMTTIDQADRLVLDFYRCAMLPAGPDWQPDQAPHDDLADHRRRRARPRLRPRPRYWDGEVFRHRCPARISTAAWRARCCTAPATWSAAHPNWPGSP